MFVACTKASLVEITEIEFNEGNTFLSLDPCAWCRNFGDSWQHLLAAMDLRFSRVEVFPVTQIPHSEFLAFSFTINQLDSFFFISQDLLKKNLLFLNAEADSEGMTSLVVEYFVRKFLFDVFKNWNNTRQAPHFQFIGHESSLQIDGNQNRFLKGTFKTDKFDLDFYVLLPDEFLYEILNEFPVKNILFEHFIANELSENLFCRFDISSFFIPTKELIDFVREGKLIHIPEKYVADTIQISIENKKVATGYLRRMREQIVVSIEGAREQETVDQPPQETLLTISLGYKEFTIDELRSNPKFLKFEDASFPEVNLIVSHEIIAKGVLGFDQQGDLCVKVS